MNGHYVVRRAAGSFFAVNVLQKSGQYERPVMISESGAHILEMLGRGMTANEIAKQLKARSTVSEEEILADIDSFIKGLEGSSCSCNSEFGG